MRKLKWGLLAFALVLAGCGDSPEEIELRKAELAKEATIEAARIAADVELRKAEMQASADRARLEQEKELAEAGLDQGVTEAQLATEAAMNQMAMNQAAELQANPELMVPPAPGNYQNYYGSPEHGQWMPNGQFVFNDPLGMAAQSTNSFLMAAGLGGLAGYMASKAALRSNWNRNNPHGYAPSYRRLDNYRDYRGNPIDHAAWERKSAYHRQRHADALRVQEARIKKLESEKRQLRDKSLRQSQELRRQQMANLKKKQSMQATAAQLQAAKAAKLRQEKLKKYYSAGGNKVPAQGTLASKKNNGKAPTIVKVYKPKPKPAPRPTPKKHK